jgi:hypothetical protein
LENLTMRNFLFTLVAGLTIGATGCVGGLEGTDPDPTPPNPTGDATAKELFETNVAPTTTAKCSGCHTAGHPSGNVTGFVDANQATAYDTIVGYVAVVGSFDSGTAPILTKIAAGHQGLSYTQTQLSQITEWLDKEVATRNPNTQPPTDPTTPTTETASQANKRLLKQWSGCMTKTDFDTANMAGNVGGWQATNNQECDNCHAVGAEGFIASRDVGGGGLTFFNTITQHSAYMQQYFIVDMSGGTATASVKMNRASFDGVSTRKAPHVEHPTFDSTDNGRGIQAISQFYTLTMAHAATPATCEVPAGRLID